LKIRFLGTHNSESNDAKLVSILVDDIIALDSGSITTGLSFTEQNKIQAIFLSHGHYDHLCGIPTFAFNNSSRTTPVFAMAETLDMLNSHLIDGNIYPKFSEKIAFLKNKALQLISIKLFKSVEVNGYIVMPVPVNHPLPATGFVISKEGKCVFYTGDTGPGLTAIWENIAPQLLIIDTTYPDKLGKTALEAEHLCPGLLKIELMEFHKVKGYLPQIAVVHLYPRYEKAIRKELEMVARELGTVINIVTEDQKLFI